MITSCSSVYEIAWLQVLRDFSSLYELIADEHYDDKGSSLAHYVAKTGNAKLFKVQDTRCYNIHSLAKTHLTLAP